MSEESVYTNFNDLMAEEDDLSIKEAVNLKMEIAGNVKPDPVVDKEGRDPHATRWLFNPFEIVDLRNVGESCGFPYLRNVVFNKVKTIQTRIRANDHLNIASNPAGSADNDSNYTRFARTAAMISDELTGKYGGVGVVEIKALEGAEDEDAQALLSTLFGDQIECVVDPNNEDHPCPVLPELLETMAANVQNVPAESKAYVVKAATDVRRAVTEAMKYARTRIKEAQDRLNDEKSPNRTLADSEERCYLALGEEVPNQMPFLTKSASDRMNQTIDSKALGSAIAEGLKGVIGGAAAAPAVESIPDFAMGQEVSVGGNKGIVAYKPGGRITVEFEGGERQTYTKEELAKLT